MIRSAFEDLRPRKNGRAFHGAAVLLFLLSGEVATAKPEPAAAGVLVVEEPHARFGDRFQFDTVTWTYAVSNPGKVAVRITDRVVPEGTGRISVEPETLTPGARGRIEVTQPLADRLGEVSYRYSVRTDEPGAPRYRFSLSGFVQSAFDPERPRLDFGELDRARGGNAETSVTSREIESLTILGVEAAPDYLQVSFSPEGPEGGPIRIAGTIVPGAPQGILAGVVVFRTNLPHQPLLPVQFAAQVFGDVVPQGNPASFGAIRLGETGSRVVRLVSRSGQPFEVVGDDPLSPVRIAVRPCEGVLAPAACQEVELRFAPLAPGPFSDSVEIEIAGQKDRLPIRYSGLAIRPTTQIREIGLPAGTTAAPRQEKQR